MTQQTAHSSGNALQPRDYPTVPDAARYLDVSEETVRRWIRNQRLKAVRVGPRRLRIDPESLAQMVQAQ